MMGLVVLLYKVFMGLIRVTLIIFNDVFFVGSVTPSQYSEGILFWDVVSINGMVF